MSIMDYLSLPLQPSYDKSSGGSQLKWLETLARGLVDHESPGSV